MATQRQENGDAADAQKRNPYPYYSFQKSEEIAVAVRDLGGVNGEVPKSLIAHHLGIDETSPTLIQTLGAAKTFGMIDGRGAYALTERAKRYFHPETDHERQQALLEMLKMPSVFEALIDRFDGQRLPTTEMLANILHRQHKVAESWRPRIASLFLSSLREAKIIDSGGFLRYKASLHRASAGTLAPMKDVVVSGRVQPQDPAPAPPSERTHAPVPVTSVSTIWQHEGIRVETPRAMSAPLWKKLADYVNVLKPEGESEKE